MGMALTRAGMGAPCAKRLKSSAMPLCSLHTCSPCKCRPVGANTNAASMAMAFRLVDLA